MEFTRCASQPLQTSPIAVSKIVNHGRRNRSRLIESYVHHNAERNRIKSWSTWFMVSNPPCFVQRLYLVQVLIGYRQCWFFLWTWIFFWHEPFQNCRWCRYESLIEAIVDPSRETKVLMIVRKSVMSVWQWINSALWPSISVHGRSFVPLLGLLEAHIAKITCPLAGQVD